MIWKPHATVAAVIEQDDRFLLVEELVSGDIQFNQPAGHLEDGETFAEAVIRETLEEAARDFIPEHVTGMYLWKHPQNGESFIRVAFSGHCTAHHPSQPLDEGIINTHWMTRDEIAALGDRLRSPMVLQCVDDHIAGKRFSLDLLSHVT